jgi:hypothetical protein
MTLSGASINLTQQNVKQLRSQGMSTVAIDYIWQAILESERSDDIQFIDDELRLKAEATRLAQPWLDRSGAVGREPIASSAIQPALS